MQRRRNYPSSPYESPGESLSREQEIPGHARGFVRTGHDKEISPFNLRTSHVRVIARSKNGSKQRDDSFCFSEFHSTRAADAKTLACSNTI